MLQRGYTNAVQVIFQAWTVGMWSDGDWSAARATLWICFSFRWFIRTDEIGSFGIDILFLEKSPIFRGFKCVLLIGAQQFRKSRKYFVVSFCGVKQRRRKDYFRI